MKKHKSALKKTMYIIGVLFAAASIVAAYEFGERAAFWLVLSSMGLIFGAGWITDNKRRR